jgi:hypothetical protein
LADPVAAQVRGILEGRLAAMPGAPALQWENTTFDPPADSTWLRATLHFVAAAADTLPSDGKQRVRSVGNFIVDCFTRQGRGSRPADLLAGQVEEWFAPGARLGGETVSLLLLEPYRGPGLTTPEGEAPAYYVSVAVPFWAFHDRSLRT